MRLVMRSVIVLVCVVACGRDKDNAIATKIAAAVAELPGVQLTVEHRGEIVLDAQYGFADVEHGVPVTAETVFCIGSISKPFGAAAILQLVEANKLSLDDKLEKFFPGYPRGERIRVRDLLRHTSGIVDFEYTGPWPPVMSVERTQAELIEMFKDRPPLFEPNTQWAYSTSNYVLLGEIIAKVSGQPLRDYMRDNVFARAGLEHTRFCDTYELIPNRARGYDDKDGKLVPTAWQMLEQFSVGGGICSTTRDLLRFQKALEAGRVVSPGSYQMMITPEPLADGTPIGYGFGLLPSAVAGHRTISHEGNVSGFTSGLYHFVDDELRIAATTNHRSMPPPWFDVARAVLDLRPPTGVPISVSDLQRYTKTMRLLGGPATFLVQNDQLVLQYAPEGRTDKPPPFPLVHIGNHTFARPDDLYRFRFEVIGDRVVGVEGQIRGISLFTRF